MNMGAHQPLTPGREKWKVQGQSELHRKFQDSQGYPETLPQNKKITLWNSIISWPEHNFPYLVLRDELYLQPIKGFKAE